MAVVGNIPQKRPSSLWDFIRGKKSTEQTAVDQKFDPTDNTQRGAVNYGLGVLSLLSLPAITNVFRLAQSKGREHEEANRIQDYDLDDEENEYTKPTEIFGYVSKFFELISNGIFKGRWFLGGDNHDVGVNTIGRGYLKKVLHKGTAQSLSDFAFNTKYVFSNLFLRAHKDSGIITKSLSLLNKLTSFAGSIVGIPASFLSSVFAYQGKTAVFEAANLLKKLSEPFTAISANLSSLVRATSAMKEGAAKGLNLRESLRYKGLNMGHLLQGILGSIIAIPSLPGVLTNFTSKFKSFNHNLLSAVKKITRFVAETVQRRTRANISLKEVEAKAEKVFNRVTNYFGNKWGELASMVVNIPFLKGLIFNRFMSVDEEGSVVASKSKTSFGKEIFRIFEPIQSALMFLPEALIKMQDDYIQDHGTWILRSLDSVIGIVSSIPAAFNYLLDMVSSKIPQMIVTHYDHKQRRAIAKENNNYNAMDKIRDLKNNLLYGKLSAIPGSKYLAKTLDKYVLNNIYGEDVFKDAEKREAFLDGLRSSLKAEDNSTLKTPVLVTYARNFMKILIDGKYLGKLFKASVDADNLTPRQKGKLRIKNFIEKVEHTLSAIPILNFAAPFLRVIKKPFNVKTVSKGGNAAQGNLVQGNFGQNNQGIPANPLAGLANAG